MEDVARRGDRVAPQEKLEPRFPRRRHEPERGGGVPHHVPVPSRRELRGPHVEPRREDLRRVAVVVACAEHPQVRLGDLLVLHPEFFFDKADRLVEGTVVHPVHQSEREEILRLVDEPGGEIHLRQRVRRQLGDADCVDLEALERVVFERVRRQSRHAQVFFRKRVLVHDDRPAVPQEFQIRNERGRVHRHQDVAGIPGREDIHAAELDLEPAHAVGCPRGSADLGRVVGERAQIVPQRRDRVRELRPGELHAVSGIAREADRHFIKSLDLLCHDRTPSML